MLGIIMAAAAGIFLQKYNASQISVKSFDPNGSHFEVVAVIVEQK